jgi:hypothetical protein
VTECRAGWTCVTALALLACARAAFAAPPLAAPQPPKPSAAVRHPAPSRVEASLVAGWTAPFSTQIDGEDAPDEGARAAGGVSVGFEQRIVEGFGLAALISFCTWDSGWSYAAGEDRWRVDLDIAPRYRFAMQNKPKVELYVSIPVGVTVPLIDLAPSRAFHREIVSSTGWNVGVAGGATVLTSPGFFFELAYTLHGTSVEIESTPTVAPVTPITEHIDHLDHQVLLKAGLVVPIFW